MLLYALIVIEEERQTSSVVGDLTWEYNNHMRIVVTQIEAKRFNAKLFIDEELTKEVDDNRPGCAVRTLVNWLYAKYGAPTEGFSLEIDGW